MTPTSKYARYKSHADIDRIPSRYIGDLFTATPQHYHPAFGDFYGFGWCSEREMAYASLMSALIILKVDNSIDYIEWEALEKSISVENWKKNVGKGQQIHWYNQIAFSKKEQHWLTTTNIESKQYQWIEENLKKWLKDFEKNH